MRRDEGGTSRVVAKRAEQLPRREREIMDVLYALGHDASVEDIRGRLTNTPSNSAVRAMLAKLEAKGHVRHREEGLRYVYAPTTARASARRDALRNIVHIFFAGSARQTAAALLEQESWTNDELDELSAEIDRVRKETRR
jgi:predicted transcriptional regulator